MINKVKDGTGEKEKQGTTSKKELAETLSETPLTTDQKVDKLSNDVQNLNKGMFELLDLFKEVLKRQVNTEVMIEKNIATTGEVSQKVNAGMIRMNEAIDNKLKTIHEAMDKNSKNIQEQLKIMDIDINYMASEHGIKGWNERPSRKQ